MENDNRKIKSYETDGEKITYESSNEQIEAEKWEMKKKASRNPFRQLLRCKVITQGPER